MSKLYFRHGVVSSAKTLNLLAVSHNYKQQGKKVILMKPSLDNRFGIEDIKSRAGLSQEADVLISSNTNLLDIPKDQRKVHCVLVDEAQFLEPKHVDQLRLITYLWKVPVICYGLRTDFRTNLFPGSKRLLELADSIEEVKTTCQFCNKKAVFNLKHVNGKADIYGPSVQLGAEEKYFPTCYICYTKQLANMNLSVHESVDMKHILNDYDKESSSSDQTTAAHDTTTISSTMIPQPLTPSTSSNSNSNIDTKVD